MWTVFVAAWMFGLGVLVGRGTAPVQFDIDTLQKRLAGLKENETAEEAQRFKVNLEKLNFFKNLKEAEKDFQRSAAPAAAGAAMPVAPAAAPAKKAGDGQNSGAESAAAATAGGAEESAKETVGAEAGELVIQVASSKDADATRYLVDRLKKKGYPAFSATKEVPDKGIWHRIRVGPFADRKSADEMLARLKKDNYNAYIVVR